MHEKDKSKERGRSEGKQKEWGEEPGYERRGGGGGGKRGTVICNATVKATSPFSRKGKWCSSRDRTDHTQTHKQPAAVLSHWTVMWTVISDTVAWPLSPRFLSNTWYTMAGVSLTRPGSKAGDCIFVQQRTLAERQIRPPTHTATTAALPCSCELWICDGRQEASMENVQGTTA